MGALIIGLLPLVTSMFERLIPDADKRAAEQASFMRLLTDYAAQADAAQSAVNANEAGSSSIFVAGWRPFIGWCGGVAIGWQFVLKPMLLAFSGFLSERFTSAVLNAPSLDENFWALIVGMLGMGGLRTMEKIRGVSK